MSFSSKLTPVALSLALVAGFSLPSAVMAGGGGSGPAVQYVAPGMRLRVGLCRRGQRG